MALRASNTELRVNNVNLSHYDFEALISCSAAQGQTLTLTLYNVPRAIISNSPRAQNQVDLRVNGLSFFSGRVHGNVNVNITQNTHESALSLEAVASDDLKTVALTIAQGMPLSAFKTVFCNAGLTDYRFAFNHIFKEALEIGQVVPLLKAAGERLELLFIDEKGLIHVLAGDDLGQHSVSGENYSQRAKLCTLLDGSAVVSYAVDSFGSLISATLSTPRQLSSSLKGSRITLYDRQTKTPKSAVISSYSYSVTRARHGYLQLFFSKENTMI